jgi:hypothetical protein
MICRARNPGKSYFCTRLWRFIAVECKGGNMVTLAMIPCASTLGEYGVRATGLTQREKQCV